MEENNSKPPKRWVGLAIAGLVLVVLPLGAIYNLRLGISYRQKTTAELEDRGKLAAFNLKNQSNLLISPETFRGKVSVIQFLPGNIKEAKPMAERISLVKKSFDETEDIVFLSFFPADSSVNLLKTATDLGINDPKRWFLLAASPEEWSSLSKAILAGTDPANHIVMADTSLSIRKMYNIQNNPEMGRMIEHIAVVIPKQKRH